MFVFAFRFPPVPSFLSLFKHAALRHGGGRGGGATATGAETCSPPSCEAAPPASPSSKAPPTSSPSPKAPPTSPSPPAAAAASARPLPSSSPPSLSPLVVPPPRRHVPVVLGRVLLPPLLQRLRQLPRPLQLFEPRGQGFPPELRRLWVVGPLACGHRALLALPALAHGLFGGSPALLGADRLCDLREPSLEPRARGLRFRLP